MDPNSSPELEKSPGSTSSRCGPMLSATLRLLQHSSVPGYLTGSEIVYLPCGLYVGNSCYVVDQK